MITFTFHFATLNILEDQRSYEHVRETEFLEKYAFGENESQHSIYEVLEKQPPLANVPSRLIAVISELKVGSRLDIVDTNACFHLEVTVRDGNEKQDDDDDDENDPIAEMLESIGIKPLASISLDKETAHLLLRALLAARKDKE